jgi:hypothetical protein
MRIWEFFILVRNPFEWSLLKKLYPKIEFDSLWKESIFLCESVPVVRLLFCVTDFIYFLKMFLSFRSSLQLLNPLPHFSLVHNIHLKV